MAKKILLCILDGWGVAEDNAHNAVHLAKKKNFDFLSKKFGFIKLQASEKKVGLPDGQFGNSEVGHMNIGAGRILLQDILKITESFNNGKLKKNRSIQSTINNCQRIHLVGLLSDGGVHGHQSHMFNLLEIFDNKKNEILIHSILDGRDSSPISGLENLKILKKKISGRKNIKIVSLAGRFFAMDRDNRWDRICEAYKAIIEGNASQKTNHIFELEKSYKQHVTDEFFRPTNFENYSGVKDGDGFFITNYRADRVRELLGAIFDKDFTFFKREKIANFFQPMSMIQYSKRLRKSLIPILESSEVKNNLGEIISMNGLRQLRIAETEKYAHVTYFFNGGVEENFIGEDRVLVPSPRVNTYDKKPEMSAYEVADELIKKINLKKYDFIVSNFANADMVGHTGNIEATVKAIETVDQCLGKIIDECKKNNYTLIVTSDHGNADLMFDKDKSLPCTTHSINPVPFIICDDVKFSKSEGCLADIAPTILKMMGIDKPEEMTGKFLIK